MKLNLRSEGLLGCPFVDFSMQCHNVNRAYSAIVPSPSTFWSQSSIMQVFYSLSRYYDFCGFTNKKKLVSRRKCVLKICLNVYCVALFLVFIIISMNFWIIFKGERPFVCKYDGCGRTFRAKQPCRVHEMSQLHENDRCFKCVSLTATLLSSA